MPSSHESRTHAGDVRQALHRLAFATPGAEGPAEIGAVLGDLGSGLASLAQSLHQLGDFYDGPARNFGSAFHDSRASQAASYEVAWELHRASEMIHQVSAGIGRARDVAATITYGGRDFPSLPSTPPTPNPTVDLGLSL